MLVEYATLHVLAAGEEEEEGKGCRGIIYSACDECLGSSAW